MRSLQAHEAHRLRLVSGSAVAAFLLTTTVGCRDPARQEGSTYGGSGDDLGFAVEQTSDGGYIMTGKTSSSGAGGADVYLIRTDAAGETLWTRTYGGPGIDEGRAVLQATDGGYVIVGSTSSFGLGACQVYLIGTDAAGETLWTRTYGGAGADCGYSIQRTSDGGYVVAGKTSSFGAGGSDVYLVRTDADGETLWTRTCGGRGYEEGNAIRQTPDGGYIIAGTTSNSMYLVKTDAVGESCWTRTYGRTTYSWGHAVGLTSDGGYILVGTTGYVSSAENCLYIVKTDADGDTLWTRAYDEADGRAVAQTGDGGYLVAGTAHDFGTGTTDFGLFRTDADGAALWACTYGGRAFEYAYSAAVTSDGGCAIVGMTDSYGAGQWDVFLVKTDSLGDPEFLR